MKRKSRYAITAIFPEIRPGHRNYYVASNESGSFPTALRRGLRDIYAKVRKARKAKEIRGRITSIKITITQSKIVTATSVGISQEGE